MVLTCNTPKSKQLRFTLSAHTLTNPLNLGLTRGLVGLKPLQTCINTHMGHHGPNSNWADVTLLIIDVGSCICEVVTTFLGCFVYLSSTSV